RAAGPTSYGAAGASNGLAPVRPGALHAGQHVRGTGRRSLARSAEVTRTAAAPSFSPELSYRRSGTETQRCAACRPEPSSGGKCPFPCGPRRAPDVPAPRALITRYRDIRAAAASHDGLDGSGLPAAHPAAEDELLGGLCRQRRGAVVRGTCLVGHRRDREVLEGDRGLPAMPAGVDVEDRVAVGVGRVDGGGPGRVLDRVGAVLDEPGRLAADD